MTHDLIATYRLQFHAGFTFAHAEALVPYLAGLGVSHLYASPITLAVPGSPHGYDVADPTRINPELGGVKGFERLAALLSAHGMGVILDMVPNHMAASSHNPFWTEMLEMGPDAPAARMFDVFWETGKLMLPVLGDPLKATLEAGALSLRLEESGRIVLCYADHAYPLRPESVETLRAAAGIGAPEELTGERRAAFEAVLATADIGALLDDQHWRLAWWRAAAHDLNYRRFFTITDLVGTHVEDPEVFALLHRLPLELVERGLVQGLRIDHVDGLADPAGYCARLRAAVGPGVPLLVEKILEPGEHVRPWPIDGTTGYERLNDINGLFVDPEGYAALERDLRARNILTDTPAVRLAQAKQQVIVATLAAELDALTALARDGLDGDMQDGDLTDAAIRQAVTALLVHCPVYRSYATWEQHAPEDAAIWDTIGATIAAAEDPLTAAAASVLLDRLRQPRIDSDRRFRQRFQQLSGPAMAKGFEDTELYRHPVLLCVNEVGGSLVHPARAGGEMHALQQARAAAGARDLIPLATHDTKRGADTRARLAGLSAMPQDWCDLLEETREACAGLAREEVGLLQPDLLDQVLILQTLVSAWPVSVERMGTYLTKALREAKRHTSWETPNAAYEAEAQAFCAALIEGEDGATVREALARLVARLEPAGRIIGLAQVILQHTLPGTPDLYQGTEFRDFSLVDPDNRRPVDWDARKAALAGDGDSMEADREKFDLTRALLALRRASPALLRGSHTPLRLAPAPWGWFGFEREADGARVRVVVPTRVPDNPGEEAGLRFLDPWPQGEWRRLDGARLEAPSAEMACPSRRPFLIASATVG